MTIEQPPSAGRTARERAGASVIRSRQPPAAMAGRIAACAALVLALVPALGLCEAASERNNGTTAPSALSGTVPVCKTDLTSQLEALNVPGLAAAIVKNDRIICIAVAGMADIQQDRRVTPDTIFLIASVSKTITATALMQLHEQGKFQLGEDINKYLPFRIRVPAAPESPITFRQLLTHSASLRDNPAYINCPASCAYGTSLRSIVTRGANSPIALADFVRGYFTPGGPYYDAVANFETAPPGRKVEYSNIGIALAGHLVEVLSGTRFDQYSKDKIFIPLGMRNTSWRLADINRSVLATPYDMSPAGYVPYGHFGEPDYPDGMLRTSVFDLSRFLIAYMQGGQYNGARILRSTTVDEMLKHQARAHNTQGLVWLERPIDGRTVWGHDGADNGAGAEMWFDPEKRQGVILLTNGIWNSNSKLLSNLFSESDGY